jgi:hypothetical protein
MRDFSLRLLHQACDVGDDVLQSQRRYLSFLFEVRADIFAKLGESDLRKVALVAQQVVNDQNARRLDRLFDRFVATESLLIEREGKRLRVFGA